MRSRRYEPGENGSGLTFAYFLFRHMSQKFSGLHHWSDLRSILLLEVVVNRDQAVDGRDRERNAMLARALTLVWALRVA